MGQTLVGQWGTVADRYDGEEQPHLERESERNVGVAVVDPAGS